jgi:hypothetical protein
MLREPNLTSGWRGMHCNGARADQSLAVGRRDVGGDGRVGARLGDAKAGGRVTAEVAGGLERGLNAVSTIYSITCPPATLKESSSIMIGIILEYKLPCRIHSSPRCFTGMMRRADKR